MTDAEFRAVYEATGMYDRLLLPHYFGGIEDVDLIGTWLDEHYGAPISALEVTEFGCGTGRMTEALAPFARNLVLVDDSEVMISAVSRRFPDARTLCADAGDATQSLLAAGRAQSFDLVTAFWSLSYPIGAFFEELTAAGVRPHPDQATARDRAHAFVVDLLRLVAPGGHLLAMLFDAESPEQQLVTRAWEIVAPFPDGGRSYTRDVLIHALRSAESQGVGTLTHTRRGGVAWAPSARAALEWFFGVHFKHHPRLLADTDLAAAVAEFVECNTMPNGGVALPSGVHMIDFRVGAHPATSVPKGLRA
ncbi:methyltransferase domain-containing protein [Nocardia sp. NPDC057353]|uniref:methyltransferase domain-containing protein n=1 Tax=Nocardia sp. NPDC057353 TaxID=3346104 RepID=UPI00362CC27A